MLCAIRFVERGSLLMSFLLASEEICVKCWAESTNRRNRVHSWASPKPMQVAEFVSCKRSCAWWNRECYGSNVNRIRIQILHDNDIIVLIDNIDVCYEVY